MSERIDLEQARQACGISGKSNVELLADMRAERDAWMQHAKRAEAEVAELLERNKALQARVDALGEFCRNTPEMRELIGELRRINDMTGEYSMVRKALSDLLRRIDREPAPCDSARSGQPQADVALPTESQADK